MWPDMSEGEPPMKVVGRKRLSKVDVTAINALQKMANELRKGRPFIPKGVWRFKTYEEADPWELRMLTRRENPASPR
jgi:hypothetical protein